MAFDLKPGSEDTPLIETSKTDPFMKEYSHKFESLSFEGISVTNPKISIITDRMAAKDLKPTIRGKLADPYSSHIRQVIVGMDVLRHLHLYMAYKEKKLYISPAGTSLPPALVNPCCSRRLLRPRIKGLRAYCSIC